MSPTGIDPRVVADRLRWARRMRREAERLGRLAPADFAAQPDRAAAAESYVRRSLEALLDLARHVLAKGFGRAATEYKEAADMLGEVGVLDEVQTDAFRRMAGYRNRLVHLYHTVETDELHAICREHIADVECIAAAIEDWLRAHPERLADR